MKSLLTLAALLAATALTGCATQFPHELAGFHDVDMLSGAKPVEVRPSFAAGLTGGAIEATTTLSKKGFAGLQYDAGGRSSGSDAYRRVKVSSSEAPNLRWEVWVRTDGIGLGSRQYAKIMGPFRNGEEAKVMFVNNGLGQSLERNLLVVVYSPTETERSVRLHMSEVTR
ncbi:hypothetical protein [Ideonella livida]|uniref:Uncharacterized protein n=1 Tax=Ideonella livida TaxID=2707176 RepID=A0A7C9PI58_9BURK|nr:hypothetical protein [Ideonella livida]NDY92597.1 hypothetical protein [Ideonella livida]